MWCIVAKLLDWKKRGQTLPVSAWKAAWQVPNKVPFPASRMCGDFSSDLISFPLCLLPSAPSFSPPSPLFSFVSNRTCTLSLRPWAELSQKAFWLWPPSLSRNSSPPVKPRTSQPMSRSCSSGIWSGYTWFRGSRSRGRGQSRSTRPGKPQKHLPNRPGEPQPPPRELH